MILRELTDHILTLPDHVTGEQTISSVTCDSRDVVEGSLFVAIRGFKTDGHTYIDEAIRRGAVAVVVETDIGGMSIPVLQTENSRFAAARLVNRFFGHPADGLRVVGVTGTNGKTTVSYLLESILKYAGWKPGLVGTMTYRWGDHAVTADRTTPDAVRLFQMIRAMRDDGVQSLVMEVSSHAIALDRVEGLRFRAAVFTNLSQDHLDFHPSLEAYGQTKARLFAMLEPGGVGVINGDDPASEWMRSSAIERVVSFGITSQNVDYTIQNIETHPTSTTFEIHSQTRDLAITTPLLGLFNVQNVAAAAVTALELGIADDAVLEGIRRQSTVRGRMEPVKTTLGFSVIVDYAHTPDGLQNVLSAARQLTSGRLIAVFGCGGDRDRGKRPVMGRIAVDLADVAVLTSDNPRREDPDAIIRDVLDGIPDRSKVQVIPDRKEAIQSALEMAQSSDTVILAGKGHETYQEIGTTRYPFDDRLVAEKILRTLEGA